MSAVETEIQQRFPGSRVWRSGASVETVLLVDGVHHAARIRLQPTTEIFVDMPPVDGFRLEARWREPLVERAPHDDDALEDLYAIDTDDRALAALWLDATTASALRVAEDRYQRLVAPPVNPLLMPLLMLLGPFGPLIAARRPGRIVPRRRFWTFTIDDGELVVRKRGTENDVGLAVDVLAAACRVAGFPWRWARRWQSVADALGAVLADRVELGGGPVCTLERDGVRVEIALCRRVRADDGGRLRTRVTARRVSARDDQLALVADDLPRAARPGVLDLRRAGGAPPGWMLFGDQDSAGDRLDAARPLLDAIGPAAVVLERDAVSVWLDGACDRVEPLHAAATLCARWAVDVPRLAAGDGPYR